MTDVGQPASTPGRTRRLIRRPSFSIGELEVKAGRSAIGDLPISRLVTGSRISLPVNVFHGRQDGPVVWLSAAVHGDEIGGVEIIRRALSGVDPRTLSGTIVAVPIVNVHGFLNGDRYLPDRRDLNRSFPGSATGSLAGRIANLFMTEIVARSDVGIDLHTGSDHRINLPHIRADLDDPTTRELAIAFGSPLMMHAKLRDGSMRAAATAAGATVLLYEGGEAWRYDRDAIEAGTSGVTRVLTRLGMVSSPSTDDGDDPDGSNALGADTGSLPAESRGSSWTRARRSGMALIEVELGQLVERGDTVAVIRDSVGRRLSTSRAPRTGMVIGHIQQPLVNQGDAIVHVAELNGEGSRREPSTGQETAVPRPDPTEPTSATPSPSPDPPTPSTPSTNPTTTEATP